MSERHRKGAERLTLQPHQNETIGGGPGIGKPTENRMLKGRRLCRPVPAVGGVAARRLRSVQQWWRESAWSRLGGDEGDGCHVTVEAREGKPDGRERATRMVTVHLIWGQLRLPELPAAASMRLHLLDAPSESFTTKCAIL